MAKKPAYEELEKKVKKLQKEVIALKRVEEALRESEERYRLLAENVPDIIWIMDMNLQFTYISPSITKMTDHSVEEVMGLTLMEGFTPGSIEAARDVLAEELAMEKSGEADPFRTRSLELEGFRKDGSKIWTEAKMTFLRDQTGQATGIFGVSRDISRRKRTEEALRESEKLYRGTLEVAPDSITITRMKDGRYLQVNEAFCQMSGYSREEALGRTPFDLNLFASPGDRDLFIKILKEEREVNGFEVQYRKKDATTVATLLSARPLEYGNDECLVAAVTDITEFKRAQDALRESEEKYRLLVENASDSIFIIQDQQIKFPNAKAIELGQHLGVDLGQIPYINYIHPEDRQMVIEMHSKRLKGEKVPGTYSFRLIKRDGEELWAELNAVLIAWEGKPATLNFLRDVTLQKQLEAQTQQIRRLEALGTLAGGIAHDFNNLLMGIQGRTSLMMMNSDFSRVHYEDLKGIEDIVKSGVDLTKQLLGFGRKGKYEAKPTDLSKLVRTSSQMFGRTKKEIKIHAKYQKDIWAAEVDSGQIEQMLLNLYVNAWQAMPGGGELYLQTENVTLDESYTKPYEAKPGRYVKISVTDTGVGMDEATKERIFEPFFTTKEMGRGMGLGLASAYGIIKNHEGILNVYSERGEGTTFNICLPACEKKIIDEKKPLEGTIRGSEAVLLVDDEDIIVDIGKKNLEKLGYKVITARNGKEAVELYQKNQGNIDVVVLDMIMPEMGGGETYDKLKEINPDVKVILSSGYSIEGQASEILKRGCDGFIQKPFRMKQLSGKINEVLEKE